MGSMQGVFLRGIAVARVFVKLPSQLRKIKKQPATRSSLARKIRVELFPFGKNIASFAAKNAATVITGQPEISHFSFFHQRELLGERFVRRFVRGIENLSASVQNVAQP